MALIDRFRRLFTPGTSLDMYADGIALQRGLVGPFGTIGGGYHVEEYGPFTGSRDYWTHWNRYNGFAGTSFSFGVGADCDGGSCAGRFRNMSVERLYATQPHLQTVVTFRARNVAQLPLHLYRIDGDIHERDHSELAELWSKPNRHQTGFELIRDLVSSLDLHGLAYWLVLPDAEAESGWSIEQVPAGWITPDGGSIHAPARYKIRAPFDDARDVYVPGANVVRFGAFAPNGIDPVSPVAALRDILAEQIAAWEYRQQAWARGGRAGTYIYRPKDAPEWSDAAYDRFTEEWHQFQNNGKRAGETPVFLDGMELRKVGFSAREDEWADVARLSLQTVCAVYHVTPAMLGIDGSHSYASVREFRSMLYTETLGPIIRQIEQRINEYVLPLISNDATLSVKFNIDAKLAGSFEEQAAILSTATGGPWMMRNEARSLRNMPPVEGGDELIVPLNVITGGQSSPQDGGALSVEAQNVHDAAGGTQEGGRE